MPRANRYYVPGKVYHLTHRCHDRQFLFRFAIDRDFYRRMLLESLQQFPITLFAWCLTSNHVHLLVRCERPETISQWMQHLEGQFAQYYNRRKLRSGAFWEGRYHCTIIDGGAHLWNCMTYIELNMFRAGVVGHPAQWPWCSYPEWLEARKRYRLINVEQCLDYFGGIGWASFQANYQHMINQAIAENRLARQAHWTESIAVGSAAFVREIEREMHNRRRLETLEVCSERWLLREADEASA